MAPKKTGNKKGGDQGGGGGGGRGQRGGGANRGGGGRGRGAARGGRAGNAPPSPQAGFDIPDTWARPDAAADPTEQDLPIQEGAVGGPPPATPPSPQDVPEGPMERPDVTPNQRPPSRPSPHSDATTMSYQDAFNQTPMPQHPDWYERWYDTTTTGEALDFDESPPPSPQDSPDQPMNYPEQGRDDQAESSFLPQFYVDNPRPSSHQHEDNPDQQGARRHGPNIRWLNYFLISLQKRMSHQDRPRIILSGMVECTLYVPSIHYCQSVQVRWTPERIEFTLPGPIPPLLSRLPIRMDGPTQLSLSPDDDIHWLAHVYRTMSTDDDGVTDLIICFGDQRTPRKFVLTAAGDVKPLTELGYFVASRLGRVIYCVDCNYNFPLLASSSSPLETALEFRCYIHRQQNPAQPWLSLQLDLLAALRRRLLSFVHSKLLKFANWTELGGGRQRAGGMLWRHVVQFRAMLREAELVKDYGLTEECGDCLAYLQLAAPVLDELLLVRTDRGYFTAEPNVRSLPNPVIDQLGAHATLYISEWCRWFYLYEVFVSDDRLHCCYSLVSGAARYQRQTAIINREQICFFKHDNRQRQNRITIYLSPEDGQGVRLKEPDRPRAFIQLRFFNPGGRAIGICQCIVGWLRSEGEALHEFTSALCERFHGADQRNGNQFHNHLKNVRRLLHGVAEWTKFSNEQLQSWSFSQAPAGRFRPLRALICADTIGEALADYHHLALLIAARLADYDRQRNFRRNIAHDEWLGAAVRRYKLFQLKYLPHLIGPDIMQEGWNQPATEDQQNLEPRTPLGLAYLYWWLYGAGDACPGPFLPPNPDF